MRISIFLSYPFYLKFTNPDFSDIDNKTTQTFYYHMESLAAIANIVTAGLGAGLMIGGGLMAAGFTALVILPATIGATALGGVVALVILIALKVWSLDSEQEKRRKNAGRAPIKPIQPKSTTSVWNPPGAPPLQDNNFGESRSRTTNTTQITIPYLCSDDPDYRDPGNHKGSNVSGRNLQDNVNLSSDADIPETTPPRIF